MVNYIHTTPRKIHDGSWYEESLATWRKGMPSVTLVQPQYTGDRQLRAAIDAMIASNGTYKNGDTAVISARPGSIDMACDTAYALQERGIRSHIILGIMSLGRQVHEMMGALYGGDDFSADSRMDNLVSGYHMFLDDIARNGNGHWVVVIGTAPDIRKKDTLAVDLYQSMVNNGVAPVGKLRKKGAIKSHDIWLYPTEIDVKRLNAGLPDDKLWTYDEWRDLVFKAESLLPEEYERLAMEIEGVNLTIEASKNGGKLRYTREDGTDFTYRVNGRPVILDRGRIGNNSLGGTKPFKTPITNQPPTEVFAAPLEGSMNGAIVYELPLRTVHGIIKAPYRIGVKNGRVVGIDAPDPESRRILRNYTGLAPYDGKDMGPDKRRAFEMRRTIAEMSIAGFHPVMKPYIESGRLRPVTGLTLTDEKLGDHQAFGSNDVFDGRTPSTYKDQHVEHTDFVGTTDRKLELIK